MGVPHGHWKTTTLVAGLSLPGIVATTVLDRAINARSFEAYAVRFLVPVLRGVHVVVMDRSGRT